MPIDPEDPRLTAYALGELEDSERAEIEQLLSQSHDGRRLVDEVRETAQLVAQTLAEEPAPGLHPAHWKAIEGEIAEPSTLAFAATPARPWLRWAGYGVAASLLFGFGYTAALMTGAPGNALRGDLAMAPAPDPTVMTDPTTAAPKSAMPEPGAVPPAVVLSAPMVAPAAIDADQPPLPAIAGRVAPPSPAVASGVASYSVDKLAMAEPQPPAPLGEISDSANAAVDAVVPPASTPLMKSKAGAAPSGTKDAPLAVLDGTVPTGDARFGTNRDGVDSKSRSLALAPKPATEALGLNVSGGGGGSRRLTLIQHGPLRPDRQARPDPARFTRCCFDGWLRWPAVCRYGRSDGIHGGQSSRAARRRRSPAPWRDARSSGSARSNPR